KRGCAKIIRSTPSRLTDILPANGSCSISSKWLSIFSIATNAPSTASRTSGGTRPGLNAKPYLRSEALQSSPRNLRVQRPPALRPVCSPYFLVGAGDGRGGIFGETCGTGVGGGLTSINSTSKISVELEPISGPIARSP